MLKNQTIMLCSYASYYKPLCSGLGAIMLHNRLLCLELFYLVINLHGRLYLCTLCFSQLVSNSASCEVNVTVYWCLKECQYLKLSHYAPKQSRYAQLRSHLIFATIMLKIMTA